MPYAPLKPCAVSGCPELVPSGRCSIHQRQVNSLREKSTARGYDHAWRLFRAGFIQRHPLCEDCLEGVDCPIGTVRAAEEVHHVIKISDDPSLKFVESNCRSLCKPHHSKRTGQGQ